jgi:hypothetical protein
MAWIVSLLLLVIVMGWLDARLFRERGERGDA